MTIENKNIKTTIDNDDELMLMIMMMKLMRLIVTAAENVARSTVASRRTT